MNGAEMMEHPVVSVVMPAYNAEAYIEEAIHSVQEQTFRDWELIVVDDCSQDHTCAIVERMAAMDRRIRLIHNEKNLGVAKTRNCGFDLCSGDYVALLDSDDLWHTDKLEQQLSLAGKTGADVVYCSYGMVNARGEKACDDFIVPDSTDYEHSLIRSVISCSTVLLSRDVVDEYRFRTDFYHEDLVLWLQLLRDGYTACGVTDVLADYRLCEDTRSANKVKSAMNRWRIYREYLGLSVIKSVSLLMQYAFLGVRKYRRAASPAR